MNRSWAAATAILALFPAVKIAAQSKPSDADKKQPVELTAHTCDQSHLATAHWKVNVDDGKSPLEIDAARETRGTYTVTVGAYDDRRAMKPEELFSIAVQALRSSITRSYYEQEAACGSRAATPRFNPANTIKFLGAPPRQ